MSKWLICIVHVFYSLTNFLLFYQLGGGGGVLLNFPTLMVDLILSDLPVFVSYNLNLSYQSHKHLGWLFTVGDLTSLSLRNDPLYPW